nr:hypothetical protein [Tanacetum cinerariifolium]
MPPLGLIVSQGIQSILLSKWPKCFLGNIFHLRWSQSSEMKSPIFVNVLVNHYLKHGNVIRFLLIDIITTIGGTFMKRRPEECYDLIENMTAYHNNWDTSAQRSESSNSINSSSDTEIAALKAEMSEINKNLMRVLQVNQQVKVVAPNCETCGGPHSFSDCPATVGNTQNVYAAGAYQGNSYQPQGNRNLLSYRSDNYLGPPCFNQNQNRNNQNHNFQNQNRNQGNHNPQGNNQGRNQFFQGANQDQNQLPAYQAPAYQAPENDAILKNMQTNMTSLTNSNLELKNMFGQFMKMNTTSSSGLRTLPGNTITNPKEDLKGIKTRRGTAYPGPMIPTTSSSPVLECENEATKDTVHPTNNGSTEDVQPLVVQTESLILNSELVNSPIIEPVASPVSAPGTNQRPSIPYPSRLQDQRLREKANDQREKLFQIFKDLNFNISFADALILMPKFGPSIKSLLTNKDKLCEFARTPLNEHCLVVLLKKLPEKLGDPDKFLIPCDFPGSNTYVLFKADRAQSSRVPVPLPDDPYEAIRQAYLVGTDAESEPFEDLVETETPDIAEVAAMSDSAFLYHHQPFQFERAIERNIGSETMPPGLSASIAEVAAMSDSAFLRKSYRGTSELILDTDSECDELGCNTLKLGLSGILVPRRVTS